MSSRSASRNNVLAGAFLLGGVALAIAVSVILSGASEALHKSRAYTVLFSLAEGASGIKAGSSVLLGGQEIGKVRAVKFQPAAGSGSLDVAVEIATRAEFTFYTNAEFNLERPLLGSLSTINISNVGSPGVKGSAELAPGGTIRGTLAPPSFLAQAGVGSEQVMQVRDMIASASGSVTRLSGMLDRYEPRVDRIIADADDAVHRISGQVPAWTGDVDQTLAGAKKIGAIADDVTLGVREAREVIRKTEAVVDDGKPKVATILSDAQSAMDKINRESVSRLNAALDDAQKALDTFSRVGNQFAALMREETPNVRKLLANARLASDQLKFAAVEIRSQPWRLLYTPSAKESETSVLYDATRNYAQAASDLRAASEAMEAASGAAQDFDRQTLDELRAELDRKAGEYRRAEKALLDKLIDRAGHSAPAKPGK